MAENTYEFKAEVRQLLDILVHSLYTNREIFLRELISNASDALEKVRFEASRGTEMADPGLPLEIRITFDQENGLLTVADSGIGMARDEVVENIGTIAHSGSADFVKNLSAEPAGLENLIGRFGVGFYSVFMAAKEVVIKTKSYLPGQPPVIWRSDGLGTYQVTELEEPLARGTSIEVHLRDEAKEFANQATLEGIIKRHSNFVQFPIQVVDRQVNTMPALWREPKSQVTAEQYTDFYKFLTHDDQEPLTSLHVAVDAPVQYSSLLFVPQIGQDVLGLNRERPGLDLYVRRVLIQKGNKDLIPEYLGFIRGVVDSEDLPLNISRETLQENAALNKIASNLARQILSHLEKMASGETEKYATFWREHGRTFKMGYNDWANREKYAGLLRFNSSRAADAQGLVSLEEYAGRVVEGQKDIYYAFGPSREAIALNPHLEIFKVKGLEVLYLFDPLDEFALESLRKFKDFELKAVEHVDAAGLEKFTSTEKVDQPPALNPDDEKELPKFLVRIKDILGDRVTVVKVSARLSDSPVCLVSPDGGLTSSMEKIIRLAGKDTSIPQKIMEVNKDHPLIRNLFKVYQANPQDDYLTAAAVQLFESALLMEGYVKDVHALVGRLQDLLKKSSGWYLELTGKK